MRLRGQGEGVWERGWRGFCAPVRMSLGLQCYPRLTMDLLPRRCEKNMKVSGHVLHCPSNISKVSVKRQLSTLTARHLNVIRQETAGLAFREWKPMSGC